LADDFSESVDRSADGMIRIHGSRAATQARAILARMIARKDNYGEHMWTAIAKAIESKQQEE
jgi:hypothetical protein